MRWRVGAKTSHAIQARPLEPPTRHDFGKKKLKNDHLIPWTTWFFHLPNAPPSWSARWQNGTPPPQAYSQFNTFRRSVRTDPTTLPQLLNICGAHAHLAAMGALMKANTEELLSGQWLAEEANFACVFTFDCSRVLSFLKRGKRNRSMAVKRALKAISENLDAQTVGQTERWQTLPRTKSLLCAVFLVAVVLFCLIFYFSAVAAYPGVCTGVV